MQKLSDKISDMSVFWAEFDEARGDNNIPSQNTTCVPDYTVPEIGLSFCLDWVAFTLKSFDLSGVCDVIFKRPLTDFVRRDVRYYGYRSLYMLGAIRVYADGGENKGVHVDLTGLGVRQFECDYFGGDVSKWADFMATIFDYGGSFSRIDGAFDQRFQTESEMIFTYDMVSSALKTKDFKSQWRGSEERISFKHTEDGPVFGGRSYYIGVRGKSATYACLYDKRLEREAKGYVVDGEWLRFEVRWAQERANKVAELISSGVPIGTWLRGVVGHYISFLDPNDDGAGNKSRRSNVAWWDEFLCGVGKLRITAQKVQKTVHDTARWIDKGVSMTLAKLKMYFSKAMNRDGIAGSQKYWIWLDTLISNGEERLTESHLAEVYGWLASSNQSDLNYDFSFDDSYGKTLADVLAAS